MAAIATVGDWQASTTAPGAFESAPPDEAVEWRPVVPPVRGSDAEDHWFRTRIRAAGSEPTLLLDGLATICDVYLDGSHRLRSESMFVPANLPLEAGEHDLAICARALDPVLAVRRTPRARWRTKVVRDGNLRWIRTSLLGRAPGFAPPPPVVGPWRPVRVAPHPELRVSLRPGLDGRDGILRIAAPESAGPFEVTADARTTPLPPGGGTVQVRDVERWWPHTHGTPTLYPVELVFAHERLRRACGFRELRAAADFEHDGLDLHVNGTRVFARGCVWTPVADTELRSTLVRLRDGGLNLVRVVGTATYESSAFHDLCDELGLLVWQDLMFANMDYPISDPGFRSLVEVEVRHAFDGIGGRPSLAVVCGNSEVEQQVAMLGLDPELVPGPLFGELIPALVAEAQLDAVYLPSAPTGGERPFRTDRGVANYFGVGAYRRPLADARAAAVRFASECLAFANVPEDDPVDRSEGVMRDVGADWDFADVRDHYLRLLHGVGPEDAVYWDRARAVTGELMAEVFGEWRRAASPCAGGIVLWSRDLAPGSGWGLLDSTGRPKPVWHQLRRALAPVAVWLTDEGLNGIAVHVANDLGAPLEARLRVALYRDGEILVAEAEKTLRVSAHAVVEEDLEAMLGRFVDAGYAYRFGEPQHDVVVAALEREGQLVGAAFHFPLGVPRRPETASELGLRCEVHMSTGEAPRLVLSSNRLVYGLRVDGPGLEADDRWFNLEPGRPRTVELRPRPAESDSGGLELRALNLRDTVHIPL